MDEKLSTSQSSDEQVRPFASKEVDSIREELLGESPRASVLVGVAWLDSTLRDLLALALYPEDELREVFLAPLRTLGQRIDAAYSLGFLAGSERAIFHVLSRLRNSFAHRTSVSFSDGDVQLLMSQLQPYAAALPLTRDYRTYEPRDMFVLFIAFYVAGLSAKIKHAKEIEDLATRLDMFRFVAKKTDEAHGK